MINRNNKKGFTIVELVIVIAVIAILAAVLIPTFSGIIRKANISDDTALARNLNTAAISANANTFEEAIEAVRNEGFLLANLNARASDCYFVWEDDSNQFLLVDAKENLKVLYSNTDDYTAVGATWSIITNAEKASNIEALGLGVTIRLTTKSTDDLNNKINAGGNVTLYMDESVSVNDKSVIELDKADANVTIDFGAATISGGSNDAELKAFPIYVKQGVLNIKNGTVTATSSFIDADNKVRTAALFANNGTANAEGTEVSSKAAISSIFTYSNATGLLKNVSFNTPNGNNAVNAGSGSTLRLEDCEIDVSYIAVHSTYGSNVVIDGGKYHASVSNLLTANVNGVITVEDGTFDCDSPEKTFKFYNYTGNKIILKGGTFNGIAFANLTESAIRGMCNLSECANGVDVVFADGAWTISVKNAG